jgi:type VI secretion system protein ImpL
MIHYKDISRIVLYGIGFTSVAALVYLAGPLVSIGGWRPLESYIGREIAILVLGAIFAAVMSFHWQRRKKATAKIAEGIAAEKIEDDSGVLKDKMKDALATLKTASGGKADFLYDLPWYVLIGPPGSGKTTALINSGLKFPLSRGASPAAIAGVGGTRYCDWWFTEDAVLIDTAGRYTTQDSDAKADKQSWVSFLDLLKKNRPRQPINGVMVAISLEDLMTLAPAEIAAHANAIRARLLELHDRLKVDFPVYALFTKGDLIAGFMEYFASLSDQGRRQVWGATFQTDDKTRNLVGDVPIEFDDLVERLNYDLTDRLQEEPTPGNRVLLYGFPTQIAALKRPIFDFLNQIFEPTRYHANATLRGFYFTSGTQQGTPIDRLIGALAKSFGTEEIGARAYSGLGKSFFLTDLILKVIIGEAAWVSTDRGAVRRARIIKAALYTTIALVSVTAAGAWWTSYVRNRDLIGQTQYAVADYAQQAGPYAKETIIGDRDLHKVLPLLYKLRNLPPGYAARETATPLLATFGLSQRERLETSAVQVYHIGLERLFRPRLVYRLEEVLEANKSNPGYIYEALKVYLMIGGLAPTDRDLIIGWMRNDWSENLYPGAANAGGRQALEGELVAMLDLEGGDEPLVDLNGPLVEESRAILARLNVAQRAYQLLKSQARPSIAPDWVAARHGGQDFPLVFETTNGDPVESVGVPGFFTYNGFQRAFIDKLSTIKEQLERDNWVLGDIGKQTAITSQFDNLGPNLLELYSKDFVAAWTQGLSKLRLRNFADRPSFAALNAAGAPTSPIRLVLESIRDETALTRERAKDDKDKDKKEPPRPALLNQQSEAPGAAIEAAFRPFQQVFEGDGSRRQIDGIVTNLAEINNILQTITLNPAQKQQGTAALRAPVASLKNNALRMPRPFNDMLVRAAGQIEGIIVGGVYAELSDSYHNSTYAACQSVANKYPLVKGARDEIPLAEFGRVFGSDGYFYRTLKQIETYIDMSQREWKWRQDSPVATQFSPDALRQFQRADQIRQAFFATGGNMPSFTISVIPPVMTGQGVSAKIEINGTPVASPTQPNATPQSAIASVPWPGGGVNRSAVTVTPDAQPPLPGVLPARVPPAQPSVLERTGQWSFFRMLDATSVSPRPNGVAAAWLVGGFNLNYQFSTGAIYNPLLLPALREFKCPQSL